MTRAILFFIALALLIAVAHAQLNQNAGGGIGGSFDGGVSGLIGGKKGTPLTPCNDGELDFSVTTGCNTTFYMVGTK